MAEKCSKNLNRVLIDDPEEQIIISGISGRFPNSNNMFEFEHNLYNKVGCVCVPMLNVFKKIKKILNKIEN